MTVEKLLELLAELPPHYVVTLTVRSTQPWGEPIELEGDLEEVELAPMGVVRLTD